MKIAVLVSGGVDSSVALRLLKDQGHDLTAFYIKIWLEDEVAFLGECPWEEDLRWVREVCDQAQIPLQVISLQREYWDSVVHYTLEEVKAGHTPNPDMMCNAQIKFGQFYDRIDPSFEKVATGHYARVERATADDQATKFSRPLRVEKSDDTDRAPYLLKCSPDPVKDQTYFLAHLTQIQLSRACFPLGDLTKAEVRTLAKHYRLPNQARKDSQGICFLGKIKFNEFLKHHLGVKRGEILEEETSKNLGEHEGFWYYTVGQRQGLGLSGGPWYVVKKDPFKNRIYVSRTYHAEDKVRDTFEVGEFNWIAGKEPTAIDLDVKVRHGEKRYHAIVEFKEEAKQSPGAKATVKLDSSDQGIAAGQFAVFYEGDTCLGCGVISGK